MHVCAHMPCVRSWIPQDLNTSMRVGVGVCADMLPVHSSAPAQPAEIAARLFSLLLFLDVFFLLKTQHLIISHPRNITAFSQQLNSCPVWDEGMRGAAGTWSLGCRAVSPRCVLPVAVAM